ncbi:MAG: DUF309 domain-containing protein [Qingshengfaniella sp.]
MTALALPPVPHLPGQTPRPPEDLFDPLKGGLEGAAPGAVIGSAAFRAGLQAYGARYYWEAHELWEAVWMALPPQSAERVMLRGLIQCANAGLKARMGRGQAVARIMALADAGLAEARLRGAEIGLAPERIRALRDQAAAEGRKKYAV